MTSWLARPGDGTLPVTERALSSHMQPSGDGLVAQGARPLPRPHSVASYGHASAAGLGWAMSMFFLGGMPYAVVVVLCMVVRCVAWAAPGLQWARFVIFLFGLLFSEFVASCILCPVPGGALLGGCFDVMGLPVLVARVLSAAAAWPAWRRFLPARGLRLR